MALFFPLLRFFVAGWLAAGLAERFAVLALGGVFFFAFPFPLLGALLLGFFLALLALGFGAFLAVCALFGLALGLAFGGLRLGGSGL